MAQSVILVPVPSADPIVGAQREKYDEVSLHGIPSHITLLFPFKEPSLITQEIIQKIDDLFSKVRQFSFVLDKISTFPHVIFLEPEPRDPFIKLTEAIVRVFPENLPYGGKYPLIHPHLTVGQLTEGQNMDVIKQEIMHTVGDTLPIKALANEAWLMIENNGEWKIKRRFLMR